MVSSFPGSDGQFHRKSRLWGLFWVYCSVLGLWEIHISTPDMYRLNGDQGQIWEGLVAVLQTPFPCPHLCETRPEKYRLMDYLKYRESFQNMHIFQSSPVPQLNYNRLFINEAIDYSFTKARRMSWYSARKLWDVWGSLYFIWCMKTLFSISSFSDRCGSSMALDVTAGSAARWLGDLDK